jgi:hypothetical protein
MVHKCAVFICLGAIKGGLFGTTKEVAFPKSLRQMGRDVIQR